MVGCIVLIDDEAIFVCGHGFAHGQRKCLIDDIMFLKTFTKVNREFTKIWRPVEG